jgi:hypothetical protein
MTRKKATADTPSHPRDTDPRIHTAPVSLRTADHLIDATWTSGDLGDPGDFADAATRGRHLLKLGIDDGVEAMDKLVGSDARKLIARAAGVTQLGATLSKEERDAAAPWRNALFGIHNTIAYALTKDSEPDAPSPVIRIPVQEIPSPLHPKSSGQRCTRPRPWRDDEILLARLHFLTNTDIRSLHPGNAYALMEAGMACQDAADALTQHLCDHTGRTVESDFTHVLASTKGGAGNGQRPRRGNRTLKLTAFGQRLLTRNLKLMQQADFAAPDRLTYSGTGFGQPKARYSVQGYMNTHAAWAGVQDRHTNVTGIALWRQNQILDTEGLDAALRCAFGDLLAGEEDRFFSQAGKLFKHLHRAPAQARALLP